MPERKNEAAWMENQNRWQIKVQFNGMRRTFMSSTPGRKGKIEAERKADEWLEDGLTSDPRLDVLWEKFLASIDKSVSSANYVKHESIGRNWLLPSLKLRRISTITMEDWQKCIKAAAKEGLSHKSCANIRASITALYNYARKCRAKMERPDLLEIPKSTPRGKRKILQPDQLKQLFSIDWIMAHGKQTPCFFIHAWRFIVLTGLRRGELAGLRREDIKDGVMHVRRAINSMGEETGGKNENAERYIVLTNRLAHILAAQAAMLKAKGIISPWLFPGEDGRCVDPNSITRTWRTYCRQHDVSCSIHELRHTMVSIVKADVPEDLLKARVGHSKSMDTKGVYGHTVDGDAERCAALIDNVFDRLLGDR